VWQPLTRRAAENRPDNANDEQGNEGTLAHITCNHVGIRPNAIGGVFCYRGYPIHRPKIAGVTLSRISDSTYSWRRRVAFQRLRHQRFLEW
jgi:hypothetical protein